MQNLHAYLMFDGNCEEAINFYKTHLGGEIIHLGRYSDSPLEVRKEDKEKVMHLTYSFHGGTIMASDHVEGAPYTTPAIGSNIHLSLGFQDKKEMLEAFEKMSLDGEILMPLQDTFWGDHFGVFKDAYGIHWMFSFVNPDHKKSKQ